MIIVIGSFVCLFAAAVTIAWIAGRRTQRPLVVRKTAVPSNAECLCAPASTTEPNDKQQLTSAELGPAATEATHAQSQHPASAPNKAVTGSPFANTRRF